MSPGRARSKAASIAARRSAMTRRSWSRRWPAASAPARDRVEDAVGVLAARVLVGDDDDPGTLAGDPAHRPGAWPCRARRPRIRAEAMGWVTYGSPVARLWPSWARTARSNARSTGSRSAPGWAARIAAVEVGSQGVEIDAA